MRSVLHLGTNVSIEQMKSLKQDNTIDKNLIEKYISLEKNDPSIDLKNL